MYNRQKTKSKKIHKNKTQRKILNTKHLFHTNSGNGFQTTVWGPLLWNFLHIMSFNYPVNPTYEHKVNYRNFILSLVNILPCGKCRENLCKNLKKLPLKMSHMKSRTTFSKYIYKLHELINTMLNKKSGLTYEHVRENIEHYRAKCTKPKLEKEKEKEIGCVEPIGKNIKQKCVINFVPS